MAGSGNLRKRRFCPSDPYCDRQAHAVHTALTLRQADGAGQGGIIALSGVVDGA